MCAFARRSRARSQGSPIRAPAAPNSRRNILARWARRLAAGLPVKVKQAGLRSGVGFQLQRVFIGPANMDAARHAHDRGRAVGLALFAGGGIFVRIPGIADAAPFVVQRDAGEIAFDRRHHAPAPVFGDHGNPIAGKVGGRGGLRRFRSCCGPDCSDSEGLAEPLGRTATRRRVRRSANNSAARRVI